jgi:hypothetical protein
MARGRKSSVHIFLSPEERQTLERWQRATTIAAGRARRGKIILLLAAGSSQSAAAQAVGVQRTVVRHGAKGGVSPSGGDPPGAPGLRTPGSAGS